MKKKVEFTSEENREFIRLLKKIQQNDYWVSSLAVWQEVQRTFSRWAVELVITVTDTRGAPTVLLSRYDGAGNPAQKGQFHIAGGFERFPESVQETASRVARDELGVDVECTGILGIHKWNSKESPIGSHLLSIYVHCRPVGIIALDENRRFFSRKEMLALGGNDMSKKLPHRRFLDEYLKERESGKTRKPNLRHMTL